MRHVAPRELEIAGLAKIVTAPRFDLSKPLSLAALALGTFAIGTSEFASMGIIQLYSSAFGTGVTEATGAITAYAFGVIIGAPLITLLAARLNRRTVLLGLMILFAVGNVLSAIAASLGQLEIARFISGLPQGAYFGAGAVIASYVMGPGQAGRAFAVVMTGLTVATIFGSPIATFLGQTLGWRETYLVISATGMAALLAILTQIPHTRDLAGAPVLQELGALRKASVWGVLVAAAIGVGSIFSVYTFIGPMVTDMAGFEPAVIAIGLALFGLGMTVGNALGGRSADRDPVKGIVLGFGGALLVLALLGLFGHSPLVLFPALFGVGATMMVAVPAIQSRLAHFAPEAPSMIGAMNLAALNLANAIGAEAGAAAIHSGHGLLAAAWAGFGLTALGLVIFLVSVRLSRN